MTNELFFGDLDNDGNFEHGVSFHEVGMINHFNKNEMVVPFIDSFTLKRCTERRVFGEICLLLGSDLCLR